MVKTTVSANTPGKFGSARTFSINTLRKPLKLTATLKRRALKIKAKPQESKISSGGASAADIHTLSLPE
jgi:hypothetical protein